MTEHGRGFAWQKPAGKIYLGARPVKGGVFADLRFFLGANRYQPIGRVSRVEAAEQRAPVVLAPVLRLHLGAWTAHDQLLAGQFGESVNRRFRLGFIQMEVPVPNVFRMSIPKFRNR